MKMRFGKFIFFTMMAGCWLGLQSLQAQITIDSNEYDFAFGKMISQYSLVDTTGNGLPVNVGSTGGPQTWAFEEAAFPGGEFFTLTIVDPATTPFADSFPAADHTWFATDTSANDTFRTYSYLNHTPTGLFSLGFGGVFGDFQTLVVNDPPELVFPFPTMLNTTWEYQSTTADTFSGGLVLLDTTEAQYVVDAWGTVNVPIGSFSCLRVREDETQTVVTTFNGNPISSSTSTTISYWWVVENEGVVATVVSQEDETDPNFTLASSVNFRVSGEPTGIEDTRPVVSESFRLWQNFPNPFNPSTQITFELTRSADIALEVFDITGQKVATLANGVWSAGRHQVTFAADQLPSGIYLYRLNAEGHSRVRRMVLLK